MRRLSITFDDGLLNGSRIACEILAEFRLTATFYVVTGWVEPARAAVREKCNVGRSHGDWDHWRAVRDAGHEVGSHTFSHLNASGKKAALLPWLIHDELRKSREDLVREVTQPSYTISMAWNAATSRSEQLVRKHYSACRLGSSNLAYNRFDTLERFSLQSWAPDSSATTKQFETALAGIPQGGWLILQFHSFEDEGWQPISRQSFRSLCQLASGFDDLKIATVADVIAERGPAKTPLAK